MSYVPLHVHTINSPFTGLLTPGELASSAARKGFKAVAMTDRWNTYSHYEFQKEADREGVKPIFGAEIRHTSLTGRDRLYHLILLAENEAGYENLLSLVSLHYAKNEAAHVTPGEMKNHREGLIALTGSISGEASQSLTHGNLGRVRETVNQLRDIYGERNIFIELMNHNTEREWFICENLAELSVKSGVQMVVTNNDRYLSRDEFEYYQVTRRMDPERIKGEEEESWKEYYLKERRELEPFFYTVEGALDASGEIAERCEVRLRDDYKIEFAVSQSESAGIIRKICENWLEEKITSAEYDDIGSARVQLEKELIFAEEEAMSGFLLFLSELFKKCREEGVPLEVIGGDIQESIAAYILGIVMLNPLEHGLVFECFRPLSGSSIPSLELIKAAPDRDKIFRTIRTLLPDSSVFFQMLREEMSIRRIAGKLCRLMEVEKVLEDELLAAMGQGKKGADLSSLLESSRALRALHGNNPSARRIMHLSFNLAGRICHFNLNSSRIVIMQGQAAKQIAGIPGSAEENFLMCDTNSIENLGGWMFVLQRSNVLASIIETVKKIGYTDRKTAEGLEGLVRIPGVSPDDMETYHMISSGDTTGVHLLESRGIRDIILRVKPEGFDELVNALSLYRPGPLEGGLWKRYTSEDQMKGRIFLPHSTISKILDNTRGVLLYREQVREILRLSAGIEGEDAYNIEKALISRDSGELRNSRLNFIRGAIENGIPEESGQKIFDYLLRNIKYSHNKALSCSRAYLSYRTAFLKTHYFRNFIAALLDIYKDSTEKIERYKEYFKMKAGDILPADINDSFIDHRVEDNDIRSPLAGLRSLGVEDCGRIIDEREKYGKFLSIEDFIARMSALEEQAIFELIDRGCLGSIEEDPSVLKNLCVSIFEKRKIEKKRTKKTNENHMQKDRQTGQLSFFDDEDR